MSSEIIAVISALLVITSGILYAIHLGQDKVTPNLTSWMLWTFIGLALLLTYRSSGAKWNVLPVFFGFTNPLCITILAIRKHGKLKMPTPMEWCCIALGITALGIWTLVRNKPELAQFTLYCALGADFCAAVPTFRFVWNEPENERPLAWAIFTSAFVLAFFTITEHTVANYVLPVWMICGSGFISTRLILYRVRNKIPWREWT